MSDSLHKIFELESQKPLLFKEFLKEHQIDENSDVARFFENMIFNTDNFFEEKDILFYLENPSELTEAIDKGYF